MNRPRPAYLVALVVAVSGAGAAMLVPQVHHHLDAPKAERARAVAAAINAPAGATPSTKCSGEGVLACWQVQQSVSAVSADFEQQMQRSAGEAVSKQCHGIDLLPGAGSLPAEDCFLVARFGDHGAFVFVDPLTQRDEQGQPRVVGSMISISTS